MGAEIKLAVAGSGKTSWIGKQVNSFERNILITFTNQNVANINRSIKKNLGKIPSDTIVMTYTRFVYYFMLRPFEPSLELNKKSIIIDSKGMEITAPPIFDMDNYHNGYVKDKFPLHYMSKTSNKLYVSRMSKLYIKQREAYKNTVRTNLERFFDNIYVDEFQDFCDYDFKLLMDLKKCDNLNVYFVGDYYQSMVSKSSRSKSLPYSKYDSIHNFIDELEENKITVDQMTLNKSWRCPPKVCDFIRKKLNIPIYAAKEKNGAVIKVSQVDDAIRILSDENVVKLFWNSSTIGYGLLNNVNKWGYSKGDTYSEVCVILTKKSGELLFDEVTHIDWPKETMNKLYVALTRSEGNTFLMSNELYKNTIKAISIS